MLEVKNLINYGMRRGTEIYKQRCAPLNNKSLTDSFNMTPDHTVTFIEALQRHCTEMGWNAGTKNIMSFRNKDNVTVNIIKSYGQFDEATLRATCEHFCSPVSEAKQHNDEHLPSKVTHS